MADVATTKLLENDKVTVWEMVLEPGESTGTHTHEYSYIIQVLEGSTLEATDAEGNAAGELELKEGETYWVPVENGEVVLGELRAPATHNAKNIGANRYREILVEVK
jgi:quercetin dioxygenase-like cupin family protein